MTTTLCRIGAFGFLSASLERSDALAFNRDGRDGSPLAQHLSSVLRVKVPTTPMPTYRITCETCSSREPSLSKTIETIISFRESVSDIATLSISQKCNYSLRAKHAYKAHLPQILAPAACLNVVTLASVSPLPPVHTNPHHFRHRLESSTTDQRPRPERPLHSVIPSTHRRYHRHRF